MLLRSVGCRQEKTRRRDLGVYINVTNGGFLVSRIQVIWNKAAGTAKGTVQFLHSGVHRKLPFLTNASAVIDVSRMSAGVTVWQVRRVSHKKLHYR